GAQPARPQPTDQRGAEPCRAVAREQVLQPLLLRVREGPQMTMRRDAIIAAGHCGFVVLSLQALVAQADPYQFDLRSKFIRDPTEETRPQGLYVQPRIESALLFIGNINLAQN